jgi:DNA-binding MarR family transcriptional regulator
MPAKRVPHGVAPSKTAGEAFTRLVLNLFRTHGRVIDSGEKLVASLGLTAARWQVLGALSLAGRPLTVPSIGAAMGLTRQAVQKQVDLMSADRLLVIRENPAHKRSPLVEISAAGARLLGLAAQRQEVWARELTVGFKRGELDAAADLLGRIEERLIERHRTGSPRERSRGKERTHEDERDGHASEPPRADGDGAGRRRSHQRFPREAG